MDVPSRDRVLLIGMGGGGDIVSCLHLRGYFGMAGFETVLASVPYERPEVDPVPGPISVREVRGAIASGEHWALVDGRAVAVRGGREVKPQGVRVAEVLGKRVYLLDILGGPVGLSKAIKEVAERESASIVVGVDAGGDVLAKGGEEGLVSPLTDQTVLAALVRSGIPALVAVHGPGCDGELDPDYVLSRVFELGPPMAYWGITSEDLPLLEKILKVVETEASRLPLLAAKGTWGEVRIRRGRRTVRLSPLSAMTFVLDAKKVYEGSPMARAISGCADLECVLNTLRKMSVKTEYDLELKGKSLLNHNKN